MDLVSAHNLIGNAKNSQCKVNMYTDKKMGSEIIFLGNFVPKNEELVPYIQVNVVSPFLRENFP